MLHRDEWSLWPLIEDHPRAVALEHAPRTFEPEPTASTRTPSAVVQSAWVHFAPSFAQTAATSESTWA